MRFINQSQRRGGIKFCCDLKAVILLMLLLSVINFAQSTGKITGVVVDAELGDALIGVNVMVVGTTNGDATDLEGRYTLRDLEPGKYNISFSSIGYTKSTVEGVEVKADEVTTLDFALTIESYETDEVVITAQAALNSEAGLLVKRQKSSSISDAISAEQISRSGSGDAAEAVKQVVGASVVDGKYVYVRGLGERYSSTQLNGAELPSSDPNRKAFQLDLLPTNLLDNIVTVKTFTPDKPGNFSGGIVDIGTKNFPSKFTLNFSASTAYHSAATGNADFLSYQGGERDWLGLDDGTRSIPDPLKDPNVVVPTEQEARFDSEMAAELDEFSKSFNNIMDNNRKSAPVDQSYAFSIGDQLQTGETSSLGYMGSLTYGRSFSYYENGEIGIYRLNQGSSVLNPQLNQTDAQGVEESNMGALGNVAYNFSSDHQLGANVFFSRSGISTSRFMQGHWPQELDNERIVYNRVLGWKERDLLSYQLRGEHHFGSFFNTTADWTASFAKTTQTEPDLRLIFDIEDTSRTPSTHTIRGSNFDDPARYYRDLEDNSSSFNLNFTIPFSQWNGLISKFKVGGFYQESDRVFSERIFSYLPNNPAFNEVEGDLTSLFSDEYNGIVDIDTLAGGALVRHSFGNVIRDNSRERNSYTGDQQVAAGYFMLDMPLSRDLRFIGGIRYETTDISVVSRDTTLNKGLISEQDFLPSLNLVYRLNDQMNFRVAATQTLARPTFRELAPFASKEFVNGVELQGNPELKRTLIENYDLRWEWFTRPGEILAASVFYKKLKNPIERSFATGTTESNRIVTYTNVDEAQILGAEIEARLRLDVLSGALRNFSFGGNISLVRSTIDVPESELNARLSIDSSSAVTRDLQGQSPYIINLDLTYYNDALGTTASLHYNSFGERLSKISTNLTPDVFEQPMAILDLIISQRFLQYFTLKFGIKNILDSSYKEVYKYNGQEYIYQSYKRGRRVSLGISYSI